MKSLLAVLALAIVLSAGYWKLRNPGAGVTDLGSQATGQIGLVSSTLGFGKADTSNLEAELAASQAQLQETAAALESNRAELDGALQRLATLESQLGETSSRLDASEQVVNQRFSAIDRKVDEGIAGNSRLGPVEQQLASLESRIESLKGEMTQNNSAMTKQVTQRLQTDLTSRINAQQSAVAAMQASFDNGNTELSQKLEAQFAQIESLEQQLSSVVARAEENAQATGNSATTSDITNINQQLAALQSEISATSDEVVATREEVNATRESLSNSLNSTVDEKIASLSSSIDEKRKIDAGNQSRLLRQSVNRMDNQIKAMSAASGEVGAALELSNALDDRINEVENALASIDQNPALQRMDRNISARIDSIDSSVKQLTTSLDESMADFKQNVAGVEESVAGVEQTVAGMEESLAGVESSLLGKVSADTAVMKEQLEVARKKVAVLEAEIRSPTNAEVIDTRLAEIDQRISSLESDESLAQVSEQTATMKEQLDVARKKVAVLEFQVKTQAESSVTDTATDTQLAALDRRIYSLESNGVQLAAALPQNENGADLGAVVAQLAQRLEETELRLANLPSQTGSATVTNQASEQLQQQIAELENRLSQTPPAPQADTKLASEVDKLNQKLSALEKEKLAAATAGPSGKPKEYKIYFGKDSDSISDDAEKVLKSFISQEQNRAGSVSIFGFTDRSGNAAYNQRLALRRANGVRSFLIQQGFDFRKINAVDGLGEDPAASKIDDGKEDANQRTVVLYAYPQ